MTLRFNDLRVRNTPPAMLKVKAWLELRANKAPARGKNWNNPDNQKAHDEIKGDFKGIALNTARLVCLDLDHVSHNGELSAGAGELLAHVERMAGKTYIERSQSGDGLHLFFDGSTLPAGTPAQMKAPLAGGGVLELYTGTTAKYISVTGDITGLNASKRIAPAPDVVKYLLEQYGAKPPTMTLEGEKTARAMVDMPAKEIALDGELKRLIDGGNIQGVINFMRAHSRSAKADFVFWSLFDNGDISLYNGDNSSADLALMNYLPFWTGGNREIMRAIFLESALGANLERKKGHADDYLNRTIEKALASWNGKTYHRHDLTAYPCTDEGNAKRLTAIYGDVLRYVPPVKSWLLYNGKHWQHIEQEQIYKMACHAMREGIKQATNSLGNKDKSVLDLIKFLTRSTNTFALDAMTKQAKGLLMADLSEFDKDDYLLNVANGIVDLKTGELLPHTATAKLANIARGSYYPTKAPAPLWAQIVREIIPDEKTRRYFQKWCGYCLTGSTREEKFIVLYGAGGTGKSTLIETIAYTLGTYASTLDIEILLSARNDGGQGENASPQLAGLAGKRLVLSSEAGAGRKLKESKIKLITGGDAITARKLHCAPFTYTPKFKLVMNTNYVPAISDAHDAGITRRMLIAPFNSKFKTVRAGLKEELKRPEHVSAVMKWLVEGLQAYNFEGLGAPPPAMAQMTESYFKDNDSLGDFLEECTCIAEHESVLAKSLYMAYTDWLGTSTGDKYPAIKSRAFNRLVIDRLLPQGVSYQRRRAGYTFEGLKCLYNDLNF